MKFSKKFLIVAAALMGMSASPIMITDASAGVKVKAKTIYYKVRGRNGKSLNDSMLKESRKAITISHAIAATRYNFDYSEPKIVVKNGRCVVDKVDITLNVEYIYPKWVNSGSASREMRNHWMAFYKELKRHELQHGKIAQEGAKALEKEIKTMKGHTRLGCKDMGAFAGYKLNRVIRKTRSQQKLFDRREYSRFSKISKLQKNLYHAE
ncbi:MAG: DUF922 domain-containing protein [Salaquimonas sp.]